MKRMNRFRNERTLGINSAIRWRA